MYKLLLIALKDVKLAFRDRTATVLMLLAPFLLALGLGFVTGRFSGGASTGISPIPVILVNQDGKQLGNALGELLHSESLCKLVACAVCDVRTDAYRKVDDNKAAAAIVIPEGFTDSIIPRQGQTDPAKPVRIELYTNPTAPVKTGVIRTILADFLGRVEAGRVGSEVAVRQLVISGRIQGPQTREVGPALGMDAANRIGSSGSITLRNVTSSGETTGFDVLGLLAPGMALMFLMYTASYGGRTLLGAFVKTEKQAGGISILVGMVMALLGGCWYPLELFPHYIRNVVNVLPTTWAMQGMIDIILGGGNLGAIMPEVGVLLGFAVLFFGMGILRFRYE
jgi:ABC-2 type transport system permease protein